MGVLSRSEELLTSICMDPLHVPAIAVAYKAIATIILVTDCKI